MREFPSGLETRLQARGAPGLFPQDPELPPGWRCHLRFSHTRPCAHRGQAEPPSHSLNPTTWGPRDLICAPPEGPAEVRRGREGGVWQTQPLTSLFPDKNCKTPCARPVPLPGPVQNRANSSPSPQSPEVLGEHGRELEAASRGPDRDPPLNTCEASSKTLLFAEPQLLHH